jgi:hypothetical protein
MKFLRFSLLFSYGVRNTGSNLAPPATDCTGEDLYFAEIFVNLAFSKSARCDHGFMTPEEEQY